MRIYTSIINNVNMAINYIAMFTLFAMMSLTVVDVSLRYIFSRPITGVTEITEAMMATLVFMALAHCAAKGGHLKVDLIMSRLPLKAQAIADSITLTGSLFVSSILSWWGFLAGLRAQESDLGSSLLEIPIAPFYYIISFGCFILCFVLITEIAQNIGKGIRK